MWVQEKGVAQFEVSKEGHLLPGRLPLLTTGAYQRSWTLR